MPIPLPSFVGLIGSSGSSSSNFRSVFCGSFNGVDQRLQTGNPFASSTDNYDYPDSDFTISAWIKPTFTTISRVGNSTVIAGFGSYSAGKLRALTIVNGKLGFNFWATGAGEEGSAISRDDWHHVVATFDSSGNLKLYLDGVIQSDGMSLGSNPVGQGEAFIGGSNSLGAANFEYFHGHIDEVAVFNSVLSAGQVEDIYNLGQPSDLNSFSEIPSLWWRIDVSEDTSWATSEVPANGVRIKACSDRHWPRSSEKPLGPNMESWGYNNAPFFSEEVPVGRVISPVTITVSSEAPSTYKYTTSDSNGNGGLFGSIDVVRGETLTINVVGDDVELVTHPLKITNFNNLGQAMAPLTGVVKTMLNPDGPTRDETYSLTWTVPCDETISQYQYQCENHAGMRGAINVSGSCPPTIIAPDGYTITGKGSRPDGNIFDGDINSIIASSGAGVPLEIEFTKPIPFESSFRLYLAGANYDYGVVNIYNGATLIGTKQAESNMPSAWYAFSLSGSAFTKIEINRSVYGYGSGISEIEVDGKTLTIGPAT